MNSRVAWGLAIVFVAISSTNPSSGQERGSVAKRQYYVDVKLFSIIAESGLDSYRGYGGGGAGGRATVGLAANDERRFSAEVKVSPRKQDFVVNVTVEPNALDTETEPLRRELVMSELQPQTIELARTEDGRVYRLNLFPRVNQFPQPKTLDTKALRLEDWTFQSSAVILNDQDYMGRLGMSSGPFAWLDLPGLAKVEFSLVNFRGAEPIGTLQNGTIQINHESGQALQVFDVRNGVHRQTLQGGPYTVFVRWSAPTSTKEQYRKKLVETIARVRKQIESGEPPLTKALIERLERARDSDRIMMMSNGLGPIPKSDRLGTP